MNLKWSVFLILLIALTQGCKENDALTVNINDPDIAVYLKDYTSPEYKWGMIDRFSKVVIPEKYDDLRDFNNGIAAANYRGLWGFINTNDEPIIPFQYKNAFDFVGEKALVQSFDQAYQIINKKGEKLLTITDLECNLLSSGIIIGTDGYQKFIIETDGNRLGPFDQIGKAMDGKMPAVADDSSGIFTLDGTWIIRRDNTHLPKIIDSNLMAWKSANEWTFTSLQDTTSLYKVKNILSYDNQWITAEIKEGYAILDHNFSNHFTSIKPIRHLGGKRWSMEITERDLVVIDENGTVLSNEDFTNIHNFADGVAAVEKNGSWGYIDENGQIIIDPMFPLVWDSKEGLIRALWREGFGFLNVKGTLEIQPIYPEARDFHEGFARIQSQ